LKGPKAMVSGQDHSSYNCFWRSNAASEDEAITNAMADCRREFPRCYVFATGGGLADWAQAINANGGTDPAMSRRAGGSSDDATSVLSGVLSGVSAGMGAGGGYRPQPTYGGSPPRSTYGSGGGSTYGSSGGYTYGTGSGSPYGSGANCGPGGRPRVP